MTKSHFLAVSDASTIIFAENRNTKMDAYRIFFRQYNIAYTAYKVGMHSFSTYLRPCLPVKEKEKVVVIINRLNWFKITYTI